MKIPFSLWAIFGETAFPHVVSSFLTPGIRIPKLYIPTKNPEFQAKPPKLRPINPHVHADRTISTPPILNTSPTKTPSSLTYLVLLKPIKSNPRHSAAFPLKVRPTCRSQTSPQPPSPDPESHDAAACIAHRDHVCLRRIISPPSSHYQRQKPITADTSCRYPKLACADPTG